MKSPLLGEYAFIFTTRVLFLSEFPRRVDYVSVAAPRCDSVIMCTARIQLDVAKKEGMLI